eukprot:CAMPEP_0177680382 /NCGR_PEP_ID=MMETSP0447-20121125/30142_1 /TAXON_ID=0 /ORGANISM="Stygamoeba regulata, Strain BSH-02190019" /LENGTH=312 /DNA_ID=CAMNT_0019189707 /DNA_START=217 /DNA_END=1155 /DNA_ORIENTATION=+
MNKRTILDKNRYELCLGERKLLSELYHPFIVNLHIAFQVADELRLIVDLMKGGDLRFHLSESVREGKPLSEGRVRFYTCCVIIGLEYLHSNNIIHRDIKPDNLLLDEVGYCQLTDFNVSVKVIDNKFPKNISGTLVYMAPELIQRSYGYEVDMWSLGITIYEMLTLRVPFGNQIEGNGSDAFAQMLEQISRGCTSWPKMTSEGKDFLEKALDPNPATRITLQQAKSHPWFQNVGSDMDVVDWDQMASKRYQPPFTPLKRANVDCQYAVLDAFQSTKIRKITEKEDEIFAEWGWNRTGGSTEARLGRLKKKKK